MTWNLSALDPKWNLGGLDEPEIRALIQSKNRTRDASFLLYDNRLNPIEVPGAPKDDPSNLAGIVRSCQVEQNTGRDVTGSISFTMKAADGLSFDPRFHVIQPCMDFYDKGVIIDGQMRPTVQSTRLLSIPLGLFTITVPDRQISDDVVLYTGQGNDLSFWIQQLTFLTDYLCPAGMRHTDAATRILTMDYLPVGHGGSGATIMGCPDAGPNIPRLSRINIPPSDSIIPVDILFRAGTDRKLSALKTLLVDGAGYQQLRVDPVGQIVSIPYPDLAGGAISTIWDYITDDTSMMEPPIQESLGNQDAFANIYGVQCQMAGATPFTVYAYNENPASILALQNVKRAISVVVQNDHLATVEAGMFAADLGLNQAASASLTATWTGLSNPFLQPGDFLNLTVTGPTQKRVVVDTYGRPSVQEVPGITLIAPGVYPFQIASIAWDLVGGDGKMRVTAQKLVGV